MTLGTEKRRWGKLVIASNRDGFHGSDHFREAELPALIRSPDSKLNRGAHSEDESLMVKYHASNPRMTEFNADDARKKQIT